MTETELLQVVVGLLSIVCFALGALLGVQAGDF